MPIQLLAGIPWLASVIGGIFTAVFAYFAKFLTKRVAVVLAAVALIVGATTAFIALITGLSNAISVTLPPYISLAVQLVVPENTSLCISTLITARLSRWAYEWNVRVIQYKLF